MNEISFVAWNKATVDDDDEGESQPKLVENKRLAAVLVSGRVAIFPLRHGVTVVGRGNGSEFRGGSFRDSRGRRGGSVSCGPRGH